MFHITVKPSGARYTPPIRHVNARRGTITQLGGFALESSENGGGHEVQNLEGSQRGAERRPERLAFKRSSDASSSGGRRGQHPFFCSWQSDLGVLVSGGELPMLVQENFDRLIPNRILARA
jgi:hypothetical protein